MARDVSTRPRPLAIAQVRSIEAAACCASHTNAVLVCPLSCCAKGLEVARITSGGLANAASLVNTEIIVASRNAAPSLALKPIITMSGARSCIYKSHARAGLLYQTGFTAAFDTLSSCAHACPPIARFTKLIVLPGLAAFIASCARAQNKGNTVADV